MAADLDALTALLGTRCDAPAVIDALAELAPQGVAEEDLELLDHGLDITGYPEDDGSRTLHTIFVYAEGVGGHRAYTGALPHGARWGMGMDEARAAFGGLAFDEQPERELLGLTIGPDLRVHEGGRVTTFTFPGGEGLQRISIERER